MKPTEKSQEIDNFIKDVFGVQRKESIEKNICAICYEPVDEYSFKDSLSLKEYRISGMCQSCQDKIFENFQDDMFDHPDDIDDPAF